VKFWSVPLEWSGETVFIIGGGPSVLSQDLDALRGRRVIAINSSVHAVPWADILFFGDWRWWYEPENRAAAKSFAGRVVTTSRVPDKRALVCRKAKPPGLAVAADSLMQRWTSLTAATNLAAHLVGAGGTIIWLGADGRKARRKHGEPIAVMLDPIRRHPETGNQNDTSDQRARKQGVAECLQLPVQSFCLVCGRAMISRLWTKLVS